MDHDVASWVAEEVGRGSHLHHASRIQQQTPQPSSLVTPGVRRGFGGVPATPSTPATALGLGAGGGDVPTPFGTEVFLRRAREPVKRAPPSCDHAATLPAVAPATAFPGVGRVPMTGGGRLSGFHHHDRREQRGAVTDAVKMPPPPPRGGAAAAAAAGSGMAAAAPPTNAAQQHQQQQQQLQERDAARDLESDDAPTERREEYAFADILARVNMDEMGAGEAAAVFEEVCWERAFELRDEAASAVHRTVRAAELSLSADHLEAEAATWSLVWFLLGDGATNERDGAAAEASARHVIAERQRELGGDPASRYDTGVMNPAPLPSPLSARVRMAARDEDNDPVTFRINRVVAWLEGTARAALQRETQSWRQGGGGGGGMSVGAGMGNNAGALGGQSAMFDDFAADECVWRATGNALNASATTDGHGATLTKFLDPDGPTRTNAALHPTNADSEERLCAAVWRLVRGGMVDAARDLCVRAGQPWRAASLGAGAGFGPAPVGAAADVQFGRSAAAAVAVAMAATSGGVAAPSADDMMDADGGAGAGGGGGTMTMVDDEEVRAAIIAAAESAAAEEEDEEGAAECEAGGGAAKRALWKWACSATARQTAAAAAGGASAAARYEAAVYGAFAGDLRLMLGACEGDWESSAWAYFRALLDVRVDAAVEGRDPGTPGHVLLDEDDNGDADDEGGARTGVSGGGSGTNDDTNSMAMAMTVTGGGEGAAFAAGTAAEGTPRWPTPEALAAVPQTAEAILDALGPLTGGVGGAQAGGRAAQRAVQRCLILGRTRELVVDHLLRWVFPGSAAATAAAAAAATAAGGDEGEGEGAAAATAAAAAAAANAGGIGGGNPPPGLLRFAAHLLLSLQALLPDGGGLQTGGSLYFHLNKIINLYVIHLIAVRRYELVPRYARHMRHTLLVDTYARFFELLAPASPEVKARCLADAKPWIPIEGEGGMRAVIARALDDSREVVDAKGEPGAGALSRGPGHRERVLEWACLAGPDLHPEAAAHACALVRQLALQRSAALTFFGRGGAGAGAGAGAGGEGVVGAAGGGVGSAIASGEERARGIIAELLPADLQRNATEGGRPGAAAELSDWAGYLAAAAAVSAWRDLAAARDASAALDGGMGVAASARRRGGTGEGANLAAEAAEAALDAILALAAPREEDEGFYGGGVGGGGSSSVNGAPGYWLDSTTLMDAEEATVAAAVTPPAIRLIAIPLPPAGAAGGGGVIGGGTVSPHYIAGALREAIEARVRAVSGKLGGGGGGGPIISCHVDVVRGVSGDGARPEGAAGQIMIELSADLPPPPPGTPPLSGRPTAAAAAAAAVRKELILVAADAVKGDLPWAAAGVGEAEAAVLEVQSADGSDPEMIRGLCRAVCWPSLLLEGVEIEADLGRGTTRVAETCADAARGLHPLFSRREMQWLLHLQRQGEVNAIAAALRPNPTFGKNKINVT